MIVPRLTLPDNSALLSDEQVIVPESSLQLWGRDIFAGDTVKRSLLSIESAIVLEAHQEVQLQHISGKQYDKWIPADELQAAKPFHRGERVVYQNWIGTIEAVLTVAMVISPCGEICKILDACGYAAVGQPVEVSLESPILKLHDDCHSPCLPPHHPFCLDARWTILLD